MKIHAFLDIYHAIYVIKTIKNIEQNYKTKLAFFGKYLEQIKQIKERKWGHFYKQKYVNLAH